jgi:polar amino acid transport system ATP-binding protein
MSGALKIKARGFWKNFGKDVVLKNMSLSLAPGEIAAIIGPSGAGKTTFLRCINHLEVIDRGYIAVDGEMVGYRTVGNRLHILPKRQFSRQRARIEMVFQHFNLFRHMTVMDNITYAPMRVKHQPRSEARLHARALLAQMGLDEPTNALDPELSAEVVSVIRKLADEGRSMLVATHDLGLVREIASQCIFR